VIVGKRGCAVYPTTPTNVWSLSSSPRHESVVCAGRAATRTRVSNDSHQPEHDAFQGLQRTRPYETISAMAEISKLHLRTAATI